MKGPPVELRADDVGGSPGSQRYSAQPMHEGEVEQMARVEERHWWYRGLRDVVRRCLARPDLALPSSPAVLDAGCGTGANLRFLGELLAPSYLGGFDLSEEALDFARTKLGDGRTDLYRGDLRDPVLHVEALDLVVSFDALCIPGVAASMPGLRCLVERMRKGGLLVLNLPAYAWLHSEHDVAVHTSERVTAGQVLELLSDLGLDTVRWSYRLCALLPMVAATRLPGRWGSRRSDADARSQLHRTPTEATNAALLGALKAESALIARSVHLPFGSSVFAIGRKR